MTVLFRWMFISSLLRIVLIMVAVVAIFMVAESFDKARFLGQGLTVGLLAEYLLLKTPLMISEFMPVIVLVATAIYMTEISHHHEFVVIRAAGASMTTLVKPLLAAAICSGLFMFAMSEWVEPKVNERLDYMERVYIQGKQPTQHGVQWLRDEQHFLRLSPLSDDYFTLMLLKMDKRGQWLERVDARKAQYMQQAWHLYQVSVSRPDEVEGMLVETLETLVIPISLSPETVAPPNPRDMQWLELYHFTHALADAGLDAHDYAFQWQRKMAAPFACLVMVILAYSLCGHMGSRIAANSKGLLVAITLGVVFYVFSTMVMVLTGGGMLPVVYAVWWPNILFAGIAGYLLLSKEGY